MVERAGRRCRRFSRRDAFAPRPVIRPIYHTEITELGKVASMADVEEEARATPPARYDQEVSCLRVVRHRPMLQFFINHSRSQNELLSREGRACRVIASDCAPYVG